MGANDFDTPQIRWTGRPGDAPYLTHCRHDDGLWYYGYQVLPEREFSAAFSVIVGEGVIILPGGAIVPALGR